MQPKVQRITPFLWFNTQAEEAAKQYTSIFPNSRITATNRMPDGSVMTVAFELDGQEFVAMNGGPMYTFTPAVSFVVHCDTQAEVDHLWDGLAEGGDEKAQQCFWLKDRYGLSWQIVPKLFTDTMKSGDPAKTGRLMGAMMKMKKPDLDALKKAIE